MDSMKQFSESLEDTDLDELGGGSEEETPENHNQSESGPGVIRQMTDVLLQDTSHKPLDSYNPSDWSLPDTNGSRRVIRATDILLKNNLETVISDYLFGVFDLYKNRSSIGQDESGIPEAGQIEEATNAVDQ